MRLPSAAFYCSLLPLLALVDAKKPKPPKADMKPDHYRTGRCNTYTQKCIVPGMATTEANDCKTHACPEWGSPCAVHKNPEIERTICQDSFNEPYWENRVLVEHAAYANIHGVKSAVLDCKDKRVLAKFPTISPDEDEDMHRVSNTSHPTVKRDEDQTINVDDIHLEHVGRGNEKREDNRVNETSTFVDENSTTVKRDSNIFSGTCYSYKGNSMCQFQGTAVGRLRPCKDSSPCPKTGATCWVESSTDAKGHPLVDKEATCDNPVRSHHEQKRSPDAAIEPSSPANALVPRSPKYHPPPPAPARIWNHPAPIVHPPPLAHWEAGICRTNPATSSLDQTCVTLNQRSHDEFQVPLRMLKHVSPCKLDSQCQVDGTRCWVRVVKQDMPFAPGWRREGLMPAGMDVPVLVANGYAYCDARVPPEDLMDGGVAVVREVNASAPVTCTVPIRKPVATPVA